MQVMVHADHFAQEEIDPVWIAECWTVITGDRRIEKVPENREAVIQSGCKVFLLTDSNSKPLIWASAIIVAAERMRQLVARHDGHFFAPLASNVVLT
jgi:PIN like domain